MKRHSHIVCALGDSPVLVRFIWSPQKHSREILFFPIGAWDVCWLMNFDTFRSSNWPIH